MNQYSKQILNKEKVA
ncbi:TPA: hypothetical protein L1V23_003132, partial [Enterococcus faecium]|nr:hypothetical protein [Streptococcus suis]HBN1247027.1 hypothetical protein [Enterococcus faecium]